MKGLCLVVETNHYEDIKSVEETVRKDNLLHCIKVIENRTLSEIEFNEDWCNIPVALYLQTPGNFTGWIKKINTLRKSNIRIFLSSQKNDNYTSLYILSSLGIECGIYFENTIDWIALNDLMHYAVYSKARHANIEPFHYLCENYSTKQYTDFNPVYFINPEKYLYINEKGEISATPQDQLMNKYLDFDIQSTNKMDKCKLYKEALDSYQNFFLQSDACSYCKSWRICLGKFANEALNGSACQEFFSDAMDACDYYIDMKKNSKKLWQL